MAVQGMTDPNASLLDQGVNFVLGMGVAPWAALEAPVTGLYNSLNNAALTGQYLARADQTSDPDAAFEARRMAVVYGTSAFLGLGAPATLIGPGSSLGTPALRTGPIADNMLAESELLTNRAAGVNELAQSARNAAGRLRSVGPDTWESPQGLRYGPDAQYGNRIQHVLRHAADQPMRVGEHGVFDAGRAGVVEIVDEAWVLAQQGGSNAMHRT